MSAPLVVLVFGGRRFVDTDHLYAVLDEIHAETPIGVIVEGAAEGADRRAGWWASDRHVPCEEFFAFWRPNGVYDNAAGHKRNGRMGQRLVRAMPHALAVGFPGGSGTASMTAICRRLRLPVRPCCALHPLPERP